MSDFEIKSKEFKDEIKGILVNRISLWTKERVVIAYKVEGEDNEPKAILWGQRYLNWIDIEIESLKKQIEHL